MCSPLPAGAPESALICLQDVLRSSRRFLVDSDFAVSKIEFLGHLLSASGCSPLLKHFETIFAFPLPSDKPALQRFLGMLNFYRKFLRGAAGVLAPLTDTFRGLGKFLAWSLGLDSAFYHAMELLTSVPELVHSCPGAQISPAVDAYDSHVGSIMQQLLDGSWAPLAFLSKNLSAAEQKYFTFDRELLTAYSSLRHFHFLLEGREFTFFTDHKPLTLALVCPSAAPPGLLG